MTLSVGCAPEAFTGSRQPPPPPPGGSAYRYERTPRDVRLAGVDSYCALFQIASRRAVIQNDQTVQLAEGDIALLDGGRPATYVSKNGSEQWLALYLPRQVLISSLG